jgi:hypothetical protein
MRKYFSVFYTEYLYYIPQFLPVAREMKKRGVSFLFVVFDNHKRDIFNQHNFLIKVCEEENLPYQIGEEGLESAEIEYLICGNHLPETSLPYKKSVLIDHGIGTKEGSFTAGNCKFDIRFAEGELRLNKLQSLFPEHQEKFVNVGFSKLDDVFRYTSSDRNRMLTNMKLDPKKKTILYAPTFYPSSIEKMSKKFPEDFSEYNLIIKPHYFSFIRKKYAAQRKRFDIWKKYSNVYFATFEDYNLAPFYAISDLLITDESSALFEFAALNKPVICNRFLHLRLSYRLFGQYKLNKRLEQFLLKYRDVGENVFSYSDLKKCVEMELEDPIKNQEKRIQYTKELVGTTDGKVSERMLDCMQELN